MENKIDFTVRREKAFYRAAALEMFKTQEAKVIFRHIRDGMNVIPFSDYLKRYIYNKLNLTGDYREIDISVYREYIVDSFKRTGTPPSFEPTAANIGALAKNWLTQTAASRKTVLLLGFGLGMTAEEVSQFLEKAISEGDFYFRNPFEVICWYCYKNGYGIDKMQELMKAYEEEIESIKEKKSYSSTVDVKTDLKQARSDKELLDLMKTHYLIFGQSYSVTAKKQFDELYEKCKKIIVPYKQQEENWEFSNGLYDFERALIKRPYIESDNKKALLDRFKGKKKKISEEDVSVAEVEKFLCSGTPVNEKGNLTKISDSSLAKHFSKRRMSRQRLNDIISGKVAVDRFDLITLNFFVLAHSKAEKNISRWWTFVEKTNEMLELCSMGELYVANPYDCFLLMCMLTDDPMDTYDTVIEKSYE